MRTECKQARFEFHQLSQRKVKARFDGGKITSDAGVPVTRGADGSRCRTDRVFTGMRG